MIRKFFPLDHVKHQFVDLVKVVTEVLSEGMNVEYVHEYQVHSVEKILDSSQLLLQLTLDEFSEVNLLLKVASVLKPHPKDVSVQQVVSP